eukprot:tig00020554_g10856.t1
MAGPGGHPDTSWRDSVQAEEYADVSSSDLKKRLDKWKAVDPTAPAIDLKELIRGGIPSDHRRRVWLDLTGARALLAARPNLYENARDVTFGHEHTGKVHKDGHGEPHANLQLSPRHVYLEADSVPTFGGVLRDGEFPLSQDGRGGVRRVLSVLANMHPEVAFLPMLPDLVCILHLYLSEAETYASIAALLDALPRLPEQQRHFQITAPTTAIAIETAVDLIRANVTTAVKHLDSLGLDLGRVVQVWFARLFRSSVSLGTTFRIVDAYLSEGFKVFYRICIAIFKLIKDEVVRLKTAEAAFSFLVGRLSCGRTPDALLKKCFGVSLSRSDAETIWSGHTGRGQELADRRAVSPMPTFFRPRLLGETARAILHPENELDYPLIETLWGWLPARYQNANGRLAYCSARDGLSGAGFKARAKNQAPVLLLVKTAGGALLGAFSTAPLHPETDRYIGTGDTFVFRLRPAPAIKYGAVVAAETRAHLSPRGRPQDGAASSPSPAPLPAAAGLPPKGSGWANRRGSAPSASIPVPEIAVHAPPPMERSTSFSHPARRSMDGPPLPPRPGPSPAGGREPPPAPRNEQYVWPSVHGIMFGSGGAGYALKLAADLSEGTTAACATFDSDALVADDGMPGGGGGRRSAELPRRPGGGPSWEGPAPPVLGAHTHAATSGHFTISAVDLLCFELP